MTARIWPIRPLFGCGVIFGGPFLYLSAPTGPTLVDFYLPRKLGFHCGVLTRLYWGGELEWQKTAK